MPSVLKDKKFKRQKRLNSFLPFIVGDDAYIVPTNQLRNIGLICDKYINNINTIYENVSVDKYVIMPNHIHLLLSIRDLPNGTSRTPSPTNSIVSKFISTFKTLVTKELGKSIWQRSYHDHIIRGEKDYQKIWEYIDTNVIRWEKDCFYTSETEQ